MTSAGTNKKKNWPVPKVRDVPARETRQSARRKSPPPPRQLPSRKNPQLQRRPSVGKVTMTGPGRSKKKFIKPFRTMAMSRLPSPSILAPSAPKNLRQHRLRPPLTANGRRIAALDHSRSSSQLQQPRLRPLRHRNSRTHYYIPYIRRAPTMLFPGWRQANNPRCFLLWWLCPPLVPVETARQTAEPAAASKRRHRIAAKALRLCCNQPAARALDIGCGCGGLRLHLWQAEAECSRRVTGVTLPPEEQTSRFANISRRSPR